MYFFILSNSEYYFIHHFDVCQGKNTSNIDTHPSLYNLPTKHIYISDAIIKSGIENNPHGSIHLYMDNRYADPQLFSLMDSDFNMNVVAKFISKRKLFDSEQLILRKK